MTSKLAPSKTTFRRIASLTLLLTLAWGCDLYLELTPISDVNSEMGQDQGTDDMMQPADLVDMPTNADMDMDTDVDMGLDMPEEDLSQTDMDASETSWTKIFAGHAHNCALNSLGETWCWGAGRLGQLGAGDQDSTEPIRVALEEPLVDLALGFGFSCGLTAEGSLYCWGSIPGRADNQPPFLFNTSTWNSIKASFGHLCGRQGEDLFCFGTDGFGQISASAGSNASIAQRVTFDGTLVDYAVSEYQTCLLLIQDSNQQILCLGGAFGSFSSSTAGRRLIAVAVPYTSLLGSRDQFCGVTEAGEPHCFGPAAYLPALRPPGDMNVPGPFLQTVNFERIEIGTASGCGFVEGGDMLCWGGNRRGRMGRGTETTNDEGGLTYGLTDYPRRFTDVGLGNQHICAIDEQGKLVCWGEHFPSATGHEPGYQYLPQLVATNYEFEQFVSGGHTNCGVTALGEVACWGRNYRALGLNTIDHVRTPTPIPGLTVQSIKGHDATYCGDTNGALRCWGNNFDGMFGNNTTTSSSTPVFAQLPGTLVHYAVGHDATCAAALVEGETRQYCWGDLNVVGIPTSVNLRVPTELPPAHPPYEHFTVGYTHACGLTPDGEAYCWGRNHQGQLGRGSTFSSPSSTPTLVAGGHLFSELSAGYEVTCGLANETVHCWGNGLASGGGSSSSSTIPRAIDFAEPLYKLSVGYQTVCGISGTDEVWCWGDNGRGNAGAIRSTRVGSPNKVTLPAAAVSVFTSPSHSCALTVEKELYCWGNASFYALGDDRYGMSMSPTPIGPLP